MTDFLAVVGAMVLSLAGVGVLVFLALSWRKFCEWKYGVDRRLSSFAKDLERHDSDYWASRTFGGRLTKVEEEWKASADALLALDERLKRIEAGQQSALTERVEILKEIETLKENVMTRRPSAADWVRGQPGCVTTVRDSAYDPYDPGDGLKARDE